MRQSRPAAAISRKPLHIQVADRVRDMIVHGEIEAGEKVPFAPLAETLGVSLTPLREAFKVLAEEGLVEQLPNRGVKERDRLSSPDVEPELDREDAPMTDTSHLQTERGYLNEATHERDRHRRNHVGRVRL